MSSWHYAFMFPGSGKILRPAEAVRVLADSGLIFDRSIYPAVIVDSAGHIEHGDEMKLTGAPVEELEERLERNEQLLVECRNRELAFTLLSCTQYSNPYMALGWSRRIFSSLEKETQAKYRRLIQKVARCCDATYVIIVNDPPDYFEDRFLEIDGRRFLDKYLPSGAEYDFEAIWIDVNSTDEIPEGVSCLQDRGMEPEEGFLECSVD